MNYPELINSTLIRIGWTYKQLAIELGVDRSTISRWVRGEFKPQGLGKIALMKFLDKHNET